MIKINIQLRFVNIFICSLFMGVSSLAESETCNTTNLDAAIRQLDYGSCSNLSNPIQIRECWKRVTPDELSARDNSVKKISEIYDALSNTCEKSNADQSFSDALAKAGLFCKAKIVSAQLLENGNASKKCFYYEYIQWVRFCELENNTNLIGTNDTLLLESISQETTNASENIMLNVNIKNGPKRRIMRSWLESFKIISSQYTASAIANNIVVSSSIRNDWFRLVNTFWMAPSKPYIIQKQITPPLSGSRLNKPINDSTEESSKTVQAQFEKINASIPTGCLSGEIESDLIK